MHTKEPWGYTGPTEESGSFNVSAPPTEENIRRMKEQEPMVTPIRICVASPYSLADATTCEANARRICAAVNSVAGIPTDALLAGAVAQLVEACEAVESGAASIIANANPEFKMEAGMIAAAITLREKVAAALALVRTPTES